MGSMTTMNGVEVYRAEPEGEPRGAVIVIEEIWGLVDHIKDVADRWAAEGYLAVAPDILSHGGITPEVGEELAPVALEFDLGADVWAAMSARHGGQASPDRRTRQVVVHRVAARSRS